MAQQPQNQNNSLLSDEMLIGLFALFMVFVSWQMFHGPITALFSVFWFSEMFVIGLFTDKLDLVKAFLHETPYSDIEFQQFWFISSGVGSYSRWFWAPVMAGIASWLMFKKAGKKFNVRYTSESLVKTLGKMWPHAGIFFTMKIDKIGTIGKGNEAAMKPREFAKYYQLKDADGELDVAKAEMIFTRQLGNLYTGYEGWIRDRIDYKVAIIALFCLKHYRDFKNFTKLRDDLAREFTATGDIKVAAAYAYEVMQKYGDRKTPEGKFLARLEKKHAYEYTLLYSMFLFSKRGVFAPCEFRWIKMFNRTLWYGLNSVDRRVAWVEAGGIKAQWLAEIAAKRPLKTPVVGEAIVGLREALLEIRDKDNPEDEDDV